MTISSLNEKETRVVCERDIWFVEEKYQGKWFYLAHFETEESALHWVAFALPKLLIDTRASD